MGNTQQSFCHNQQSDSSSGRADHGRCYLQAVYLARQGHYTEATQRLTEALNAGECSKTEALDLQARMYAQQGMYLHAESCWRQAQSLDPSNPDYVAALERLRKARQRFGNLPHLLSVGMLCILLILMLWQILWVNPHQRLRLNTVTESQQTTINQLSAFQEDALSQNMALWSGIASLDDRIKAYEEKLENLTPTLATSKQVDDLHQQLIAWTQEQVQSLKQLLQAQAEHQAQSTQAITARISPLEAATTQNGAAIARLESSIQERFDHIASVITENTQSLATVAEVEALKHEFETLSETLDQWKKAQDQKSKIETTEPNSPTEYPLPEEGQSPKDNV